MATVAIAFLIAIMEIITPGRIYSHSSFDKYHIPPLNIDPPRTSHKFLNLRGTQSHIFFIKAERYFFLFLRNPCFQTTVNARRTYEQAWTKRKRKNQLLNTPMMGCSISACSKTFLSIAVLQLHDSFSSLRKTTQP